VVELVEYLKTRGAIDTYSRNINKSTKKYKCQLMHIDKNGVKTALTEEEIKTFETDYP
jgi:hypothetical protein